MIGPPGSTIWLLSHELRLAWRGFFGGKQRGRRIVALAIVGGLFLLLAFPLAWAIRGLDPPVNTLTVLVADVAALMIFSLMLSQTLASAADVLYTRGDLDLLFSSPLDPRKTLTVRFAALAATAFSAFALLALPFLVPLAIFGHWRWLALLPTLAALALIASAAGLALAVGLFALIGPRRTRAAAQLLAAIIGAAFFLASQSRTLFGARSATIFMDVVSAASDPRLKLPPLAGWPLRAALGQPLPLISLLALGVALLLGVTAWLSRRFATDAAAAQGSDVGQRRAGRAGLGAFVGGAFAATFMKELRLLRRDVAILAQVLLRTLFLLPATFLLLRNAGEHMSLALPGGAAVIAFLAGQVASTLTWLTLSAEESPELIACAPARAATVRNAKLAAGLAPLAAILVLPLAALIWLAPAAGLAATLGAGAAAITAGLISAWYPTPGKRSEFRRRRSGSLLSGLALMFVSVLIAAATALLAMGSLFALIPAALTVLVLLVMRRSPAQIADALATSP
ncbi:MAG TPA: putative ABC exporter domain-containing protein [Caulobacteraceae bacterium]|nr:putative ABC exporter domain-containing protein [Caulobacteraceae bacterium]